jgi:ubiquinone biosynthesis protein
VRGMVKDRYSPQNMMRRVGISLWQATRLLNDAPRTFRRFTEKLLSGKLSVALRHEGLQSFTVELEKSSNRLAFSILLAAIIVASSLILSAHVGPTWRGISLLGIAGYVLSAFLGFWLVIAILRSGRM